MALISFIIFIRYFFQYEGRGSGHASGEAYESRVYGVRRENAADIQGGESEFTTVAAKADDMEGLGKVTRKPSEPTEGQRRTLAN